VNTIKHRSPGRTIDSRQEDAVTFAGTFDDDVAGELGAAAGRADDDDGFEPERADGFAKPATDPS